MDSRLVALQKMGQCETGGLMEAFSWNRFTAKGSGVIMAATARYAASMHPIHSRVSGAGVAAAVGTELGSYSTAKAAKDERQTERRSLWGDTSDDAFERAAELGRRDATAFSLGDDEDKPKSVSADSSFFSGTSPLIFPETQKPSASVREGSQAKESVATEDIASLYRSIKDNKDNRTPAESLSEEERSGEDRPGPDFRIYHVDSVTGKCREVPPHTQPGDFLDAIRRGEPFSPTSNSEKMITSGKRDAEVASNENGYDGYQAIQEANSGNNRVEELEAMRKARSRNRLAQEGPAESEIGAKNAEASFPREGHDETISNAPPEVETTTMKPEGINIIAAGVARHEVNGADHGSGGSSEYTEKT